MAFSPQVVAALDRLANYYNNGAYDPQNNPGGLANGGHRLRFTPSLADVALVVNAIGDLQSQISSAQQILVGMQAYLDAIGGAPGLAEALAAKAAIGSKDIGNADYAAAASDVEIAMRGMTVSRTVTLPSAASYPKGQDLLIVDADGTASPTNPLVVKAATSQTIGGRVTINIIDPFDSLRLRRAGPALWVVA
ncbi:hypothetical protein ABS772_18380 [Methylorubrum podarium]|uniref:Uncharacterized protein n=1 Tax=Methylorubrum podarium TaxID=200476 RepID=A0ABV1QR76_9HYPH